MELYIEYNDIKNKYNEAKKELENLTEKKVRLYCKTQPQAVQPKDIIINSNATSDKYLNYCSKIENIDIEIDNAKKLLELRTEQLETKEKELKNSKELFDKIYVLSQLERQKVIYIAIKTNYSERQVRRFLQEISRELIMSENVQQSPTMS